MAEYLNPTAVAGMSAPPANAIRPPGAGMGLLPGYWQGEDRSMAYDLLNLGMQQQQQELARMQQEFGYKEQMNPLLIEQQGLQNKNLGFTGKGLDLDAQRKQAELLVDFRSYLGNSTKQLKELESKGKFDDASSLYGSMIQRYISLFGQQGLSLDDFNYQPGVTSRNLEAELEALPKFGAQGRTAMATTEAQIGATKEMKGAELQNEIIKAIINGEYDLAQARISASASVSGKQPTMAGLYMLQAKILGKDPSKRTGEENAFSDNFLEFVSRASGYRTDIETQAAGPQAEAEAAGQLRGIVQGAEALKQPGTAPKTLPTAPQTQQTKPPAGQIKYNQPYKLPEGGTGYFVEEEDGVLLIWDPKQKKTRRFKKKAK